MKKIFAFIALAVLFGVVSVGSVHAMPCRDVTCFPMPHTGTGNPGHN